MKELERGYRNRSGLSDRAQYEIWYSQLSKSKVMLLGLNPGGDPKTPELLRSASASFYEKGERDYLDTSYTIQAVMLPFLRKVFGYSDDEIRDVTKTNLIFRRSPSEDRFKAYHGMTIKQASREAEPVLSRIIEYSDPDLIVLECMKPELFERHYACGRATQLTDPLMTMYRGSSVRLVYAATMYVRCLAREVPVVALAHPSHFGYRLNWEQGAIPFVKDALDSLGVT